MLSPHTLRDLFIQEDTAGLKRCLRATLSSSCENFTPTWHPLGFVHCKLADEFGETYRLHLWLSNQPALLPQEHKIHDHLFDVTSIVLTGAVESREYDLVPASSFNSLSHRILRVDYAADGPRLFEDGATGTLLQTDRRVIGAGASYSIKREGLHESSNCTSSTSIQI